MGSGGRACKFKSRAWEGTHGHEQGREMRSREKQGEWTRRRRRRERDKRRLIGGERRERRLDEPWEVLLNCQIATSCELFSV